MFKPDPLPSSPCVPQIGDHGDLLRLHQWWDLYGAKADLLQPHAMRTLAQPASSSSCERGWSTYDFIHSKRRNRLTPERARDLVYVFTNGRLADKMASGEAQEEFVGWDAMAESEDATE